MAAMGGLAGFGGFDPGDIMGAIGQSLLTSPRTNPLQGLPAGIAAMNKQNEQAGERQAMMLALTKAGIDAPTAAIMARNPTAAALMISQGNQEKARAFTSDFIKSMPALPGSTSTPPSGPANKAGGLSDLGGFPASLVGSESGGNWSAQNNVPGAGGKGHFGRLQFSRGRLQEAADAGVIPQGTTPEQFMGSPEMQQAAEKWHFGDIDQKIVANGFDKMVGQQIGGVPITVDGMRAVAHLGGSEGLRKFITTGGRYNPSDANGTSLRNYFTRHAGNTSVPPDAAADQARVAEQGGPRQVLSAQNPLVGPSGDGMPTQPYQVAGAGGKVPVPLGPPPAVPKADAPPGNATAKAQATQLANWALRAMVAAGSMGDAGKGVVEGAKGYLDVAKQYLKPDELMDRLEAAGIDPRSDVGRDALSGGALARQQGFALDKDKFEFEKYDKDRAFRETEANNLRTSSTRDYARYRAQELNEGRQPKSFLDYQTQLARAGSPQPEGVEDVERAKSVTKFLTTEADRAPRVAQRSADLDMLSAIITKTPTGGGADTRAFLDRIGQSLGVTEGKLATQKDAIDAITSRIAPSLREPGSGAQSDAELKGFLSSLASLTATPEGNQLIQSTLRRAADLDARRTSIAAEWQAGNISASQARRSISEIDGQSIYASPQEKALFEKIMGGQPDRVQTPAGAVAPKMRWVPGKGLERVE